MSPHDRPLFPTHGTRPPALLALLTALAAMSLAALLAAPASAQEASGPTAGNGYTIFSPHVFQDPMANNVDAIAVLAPKDWQASAQVVWLPSFERGAQLLTSVTDPATGVTVEWLPIQDFIYFDVPQGFSISIGDNYQGKVYAPPITDPEQFLEAFWLPGSLAHLRGATIQSIDQVPEIAQEFLTGFGGPGNANAYRIRYAYTNPQDGTPWEEEVDFALLVANGNGVTSWYVNFAYAARGPAGSLDQHAGEISTIVASRQTTPQWEAIYRLVQQLFVQGIQQQMADTQAFGNLLAQYRAQTEALQAQVAAERQASEDHIADLRGETLQGIGSYINPIENSIVQLPSNGASYWVDQQGNYFVSDGTVDPNQLPNGGGWTQMQPRTP